MQACACRVRPGERSLSQMSLWVFSRFVCFCDICHFRRAGMSYRVNAYSLSGGGSIDWVPGVVSAAWGGLWRAWRAVRAAPKTRNYTSTRVKVVGATLVGSMAPLDAVSPEGGAVAAATERAHVRARAHRQRFFDAVRRAHRRRRSRWQSFFLTAAPRLRPFEPTDTPPTISARTSSSALPGRATRRGRWRIRQVRRAPSALRTHR